MESNEFDFYTQSKDEIEIFFTNHIVKEDNIKGQNYVLITNADGKKLVLCSKYLKVAFCLYQPSALMGQVLKFCFPAIYSIPSISDFSINVLGFREKKFIVSPEILHCLGMTFKLPSKKIGLSFFLGTPSVHQKITIQISYGSHVLGYCKITTLDNVKENFYHEQSILDELNFAGVKDIPNCLYCNHLSESNSDVSMFIQSTIKTSSSSVTHRLLNDHFKFLYNLFECTKASIDYFDTDYHSMIMELKSNIHHLRSIEFSDELCLKNSERNQEIVNFATDIISDAIVVVEESLCNCKYFSVYHGDFTPWNMFFEDKRLFVFDFEYAKRSYPPMIDVFHYFTQTLIYIKKISADDIYRIFKRKVLSKKISRQFYTFWSNDLDIKLNYCYYLLEIIALYLKRDKGNFSNDIKKNMEIWVLLLKKLIY